MASTDWIAAWQRPTWIPPGTWWPSWLALRAGTRPLVIVAPHGGRRRRPVRRGDGVNDLATADLASELAERLDAHALINTGLDRNRIDLNRTSEVAAKAPAVARLLVAAVEAAGRSGEVPLVLFVHGWNMVVPCCDLGLGLREVDDRLFGVNPTLSRAAYDGPVTRLRKALTECGLVAAVGRRYPASGADNLCQVFSGRFEDHENTDIARLSELARRGRVDAAQLELAIPLRWPGPEREAFLTATATAFGGQVAAFDISTAQGADGVPPIGKPVAPSASSPPPLAAPSAAPATPSLRLRRDWELPPIRKGWRNTRGLEAGYGLQAALADGAGLFCGVEPAGPQNMAARFSVLLPDGPMFLLVGEGPWDGTPGMYGLEGLRWHARDDGGARIVLDGAMIRYPGHDAYLDLERGLSASRLARGRGELHYRATGEGRGRIEGSLDIDGHRFEVADLAFAERGGRAAAGARLRLRLLDSGASATWNALPLDDGIDPLPADGGAAAQASRAYRADADVGAGAFVQGIDAGAVRRIVSHDEDGAAPSRLELVGEDESALLSATVRARVPVWRDVAPGLWARWTFGLVKWSRANDSTALPGLFERLELFRET